MKHKSSPDPWPFEDSKNVAVFTTIQILRLGQPVLHVSHDEEDGSWQFHTGENVSMGDMLIVALEEMVSYDTTLADLADLPYGWSASRTEVGAPWSRQKD
ncbi:MAG: hypothetical protein V4662_03960 [Verrucomicrobiota bacterium]